MKRSLLVLIVLGVLAPAAGAKGGPQPLGVSWQGGYQFSRWIEQEDDWPQPPDGLAIINPFGSACKWSVNDHEHFLSTGYLDAGATVSRERCVVSDYDPVLRTINGVTAQWSNSVHGMSTARVWSKSADLVLSVCFEPQGRCFTAAPIFDAQQRQYRYDFCGQTHYFPGDVVEIPNSNGGHGVLTTVTTTLANPTERRVRDVMMNVGFASDIALLQNWPDAQGCPLSYPHYNQAEYPFRWTS